MLYMPGEQAVLTFPVPDANGDNVTGLSWTTKAITKDATRIVSGTEFSSFSISEHVSTEFYVAVFTPASSSSAVFGISAKSDAAVPDVLLWTLEPDWARIVLLAEKMEHTLGSPETVTYYMPDGSTIIRAFNMSRVGTLETREGA